MIKNLLKLVCLSLVLVAYQNTVAGDSAEIQKIKDVLKTGNVNNVLSVINDAKELSYQGELIQFMLSLWKADELPDGISRSFVSKDVIKINVADFIMQAYKNGLVQINKEEYQEFAQKVLLGNDVEAKSQALFVLAHIDDPEDVSLIKPLVLSESEYLYRSAALALAMMCNEEADKVLLELTHKADKARRDYINDTREKFLSMKKKGHYCR